MYMGFMEIVILFFMQGGLTAPLGVPPLPDDPLLAKVAPDEVVYYFASSGMDTADPESKNATERLAANEELATSFQDVTEAMKEFGKQMLDASSERPMDRYETLVAAVGPELLKLLLTRACCHLCGRL